MTPTSPELADLLAKIAACRVCEPFLPLGPRPVLSAHQDARLLIVGQAPGLKVHTSGVPWNDASGDRLRAWLELSRESFYDASRVAIVPMGFCYPGKGKSGDLPPRPECAPLWHDALLKHLPNVRLTLLIGQYAQARYLGERRKKTLTDTVRAWREYIGDGYLPIVHPSPRNGIWLGKNPWFEESLVPELRSHVHALLG